MARREATALPMVGLVDRSECRGETEQPRSHTAADKQHSHCQSRPPPSLFLASRKNRTMPNPLLGVHGVLDRKKDVVATFLKTVL